jgi:hypothetical protein
MDRHHRHFKIRRDLRHRHSLHVPQTKQQSLFTRQVFQTLIEKITPLSNNILNIGLVRGGRRYIVWTRRAAPVSSATARKIG